MTLALRVRREQRAQAALQRGRAEHAAAAEEAEQMERAVSLQTSARLVRERQIYQGMCGRSFSAREIACVDAELRQLDRAAAGLAAQLAASMRTAETAYGKVEALRRHFGGLHRARRKWDELLLLADGRRKARQALLEELSVSDDSIARPRS
jgi:hypothetical protein